MDRGQTEAAVSDLYLASLLDASQPGLLADLGTALAFHGQLRAAVDVFCDALRLDPERHDVAARLAWIRATHQHDKVRDADAATSLARFAVSREPTAANLRIMAAALAASGRFDEALATIDRAMEQLRNETSATAGDPLGKVQETLAQQRDLYAAGKPYRGRRDARLTLAALRVARGSDEAAAAHYAAVLQANPDDPVALVELGVVRENQQQTLEAIGLYYRASQLRPDWHVPLNNMAWIAATHPQPFFRDAIRAMQLAGRACRLTERRRPGVLDTLAAAYAEAGRFDRAVAACDEALTVAAGDGKLTAETLEQIRLRRRLYELRRPFRGLADACLTIGATLSARGQLMEAEQLLSRATADQSLANHSAAWHELGLVRERLGRAAAAVDCYRRALQLDPTLAAATNNLAWLLATYRDPEIRNPREAVRLAAQLCEASDDNAFHFDTLAVAQAAAGEYSAAADSMSLAVAGLPATADLATRWQMRARLELFRRGQPYVAGSADQPSPTGSPTSELQSRSE